MRIVCGLKTWKERWTVGEVVPLCLSKTADVRQEDFFAHP